MRFGFRFAVPMAAVLLTGCQSGDAPSGWSEYARQGAYSASISPAASYVSLGSSLHGGSLWDLAQNARLFNWNHKTGEYSLISATAFSPDEKYAVTADQQALVLWETETGKALEFLSSQSEILDLALSQNGDFALVGQADHNAVYFDLKNGGANQTLHHEARVRAVGLDKSGQFAITGSDAYKARIWNLTTGELQHTLEFDNTVDTVALSDDGKQAFSSATLNRAVLWSPVTGEELVTLSSDKSFFAKRVSYLSARFSPDGRQLLTGTSSGAVQLWDTRNGNLLRTWALHKRDPYGPTQAAVYDVAFGKGRYFAVGSNGILNELK